MKSRVTDRGQVTIPKKLREQLGIRPGSELEFVEKDGKLIASKVSDRDRLRQLRGIIDLGGKTTDEIMEELRGDLS